MCILLVEDEVLIRLIVAEELAEAGYAVREAESGDEASALIEGQADEFTLLVTDIHMPGELDGMAVARLLRERRPEIPVVYMTGRPGVLNGTGALGDGAVLMAKPFAPSQLLAVVRRLLGGGDGSPGCCPKAEHELVVGVAVRPGCQVPDTRIRDAQRSRRRDGRTTAP
jgi:DNA-binding response OmpR family regulator